MIPFDFEYYKPASAEEAVQLFDNLNAQGKEPMYYSGGTEIISFSRLYQLYPKAVIDIKGIPECNVLGFQGERLVIGAAVTLSQIQESDLFPLLSWCGGRVADRTIRNKITLGGNICARIPYREAVLALLLAESELEIAGRNGRRRLQINEAFNEVLHLDKGELLLQVSTDRSYINQPFYSTKKTTEGNVGYPQDKIGYPVVSLAAMKKDNKVRVAVSGLCNYPFRSTELEQNINDRNITPKSRLNAAVISLPAAILDDMEGSAGYREFVFRSALSETMEKLEGVEF